MTVRQGQYLWIPCEVKPGPFSDERMIRIELGDAQWVGFVPVTELRSPVDVGTAQVRGFVREANRGNLLVSVRGYSVGGAPIHTTTKEAAHFGAVPA